MVTTVKKLIRSEMLHVFNARKINTICSVLFVGTDYVFLIFVISRENCLSLIPLLFLVASSGSGVFRAYLQRVILADLIKK